MSCKKTWEHPEGEKNVTVYHYGTHTCVPIKRTSSTTAVAAMAAFKQSPTLKLEGFVNDKLIEDIENDKSLTDIEELADSFVDRQALS